MRERESQCQRGTSKRTFKILALLVTAVLLQGFVTAPASAKSRKRPTRLAFWNPQTEVLLSSEGKISWKWAPHSGLTRKHKIRIVRREVGTKSWKPIARRVPLGKKSITWDVSNLNPDDAAQYEIRFILEGKKPRKKWRFKSPAPIWRFNPSKKVWVDHIPPEVTITEPAPIYPPDPVPYLGIEPITVAAGPTKLSMNASDLPERASSTNVFRSKYWRIQAQDWTIEKSLSSYNFPPGKYIITAIAVDAAGNKTESRPIHLYSVAGNNQAE